jgi:quercetin dioxygenase-like cupin family protein
MYDQTDPRSRLAASSTSGAPSGPEGIAAPEYLEFSTLPAREADGARSWTARGQNFVAVYSEVEPGARLERVDQPSEYVVVLAEPDMTVEVHAQGRSVVLDEPGVVIVPPGPSSVVAGADGGVVRVFASDADDVAREAVNAASYDEPHPRVAPPAPAKEPRDGYALKVHRLSDHPPEPGRFGAIFRTSQLMVNFLDPQEGPRDPEKLSPHHHDDFEQGSLTLRGTWVHHIRTPWTTRRSAWREDEHRRVEDVSLTIIPPPTVHTSEAVGQGINVMLDLFAPPRTDFIAQGWVLNDDDYPAP